MARRILTAQIFRDAASNQLYVGAVLESDRNWDFAVTSLPGEPFESNRTMRNDGDERGKRARSVVER